MATTGTQALNAALAFIDEMNSTEYNTKAIIFINVLCEELYPYSDNYTVVTGGVRPVVTKITTLSDTLGIDDVLAGSVLPYGLAAKLLLSDGDKAAQDWENVYQERLANAKRQLSAVATEIEDVYNFAM